MRITTDLFIVFCYLILLRLVSSMQTFPNKTMNQTTSRSSRFAPRFIPNRNVIQFDRSAYPEPLPSDPPKTAEVTPYKTLYQGLRYKDDTRVFRKRFDFEAMLTGQQIVCQGLFDCIQLPNITYSDRIYRSNSRAAERRRGLQALYGSREGKGSPRLEGAGQGILSK